MDPAMYKTLPDLGSGSEAPGPKGAQPALPNPYVSGAKAVLPSLDSCRWSRTGLASEYEPSIELGLSLYTCPLPLECGYSMPLLLQDVLEQ